MRHNFRTIRSQEKGFITTLIALSMVLIVTIILLSTHNTVTTEARIFQTQYANQQAIETAEAGLHYGAAYYLINASAIQSGTFPTTPVTGTLTNSQGNTSTYSFYYTRPDASQPQIIKVNASGTSFDSAANAQSSILLASGGGTNPFLKYSIVSQGAVTLSGSASIQNMDSAYSIYSGQAVSFSGAANTQTASAGSSKSNIGSDVTQNDSTLAGMSSNNLFQSVFNRTKAQMQAAATVTLPGGSQIGRGPNGTGSKSKLTDIYQGGIMWINGSATISANGQVGTPENPVILIVNGDFTISGGGQFFGIVYVANTVDSKGQTVISKATYSGGSLISSGSSIAEGTTTISGGSSVHNTTIINSVGLGTGSSGPIPGTWIDY